MSENPLEMSDIPFVFGDREIEGGLEKAVADQLVTTEFAEDIYAKIVTAVATNTRVQRALKKPPLYEAKIKIKVPKKVGEEIIPDGADVELTIKGVPTTKGNSVIEEVEVPDFVPKQRQRGRKLGGKRLMPKFNISPEGKKKIGIAFGVTALAIGALVGLYLLNQFLQQQGNSGSLEDFLKHVSIDDPNIETIIGGPAAVQTLEGFNEAMETLKTAPRTPRGTEMVSRAFAKAAGTFTEYDLGPPGVYSHLDLVPSGPD